jgi:hypothetical protein
MRGRGERNQERKKTDPLVRQAQRQQLWRRGGYPVIVMSTPTPMWPRHLGAKNPGAETCELDANRAGTEVRVYFLEAYLQGQIC